MIIIFYQRKEHGQVDLSDTFTAYSIRDIRLILLFALVKICEHTKHKSYHMSVKMSEAEILKMKVKVRLEYSDKTSI